MAAIPPVCDFNRPAPDFALPGVDGETYALADIRGPNGTLIMFICNHCPYVKAIAVRIARDAHELAEHGIGAAAICANDAVAYPEDGFDAMKAFAAEHGFRFPYLHDESQAVARAYEAVCTPDFFGFNKELRLQYRGRLDASRASAGPPNLPRDLFDAMAQIARTGEGPRAQTASVGCSIKWRA